MLSFKSQEIPQNELAPRWKIGIDKQQVAVFVGLALIAGFILGFASAKFIQRAEEAKAAEQKRMEEALGTRKNEVKSGSGVYQVTNILHADTLEIEQLGTVRLIGIETPDNNPNSTYQETARDARSFTEKNLLNQEVRIEFDPVYAANGNKDAAGQTAAYVYTKDGLLINAELLKQGLAFVKTSEKFKLAEEFNSYEREALMAMRGVWGSSTTASMPPTPTDPTTPPTDPNAPGKRPKLTPMDPSAVGPNITPGGIVTQPTTPSVNPGEPVVMVSGDRMYHKAGCEYLGKKGKPMGLSQAKSSGYAPCSRCFPSTGIKQ
ncbi:MAG: thermonuclease family protein [Acidobacteriota bacterium]